eukprot:TRINITY_DN65015_c0_g1_i1.p1 TRINITY_DN65015_c0_g1~~TRINITY_DN65015_c0_g1_i1.p1  ORF type:complete len:382 (+),score=41.45 TRINITY_DN65015_c0_g1_i1:99-1244(+)
MSSAPCALKLTRKQDGLVYVFALSPSNPEQWIRTDDPSVLILRNVANGSWRCALAADPDSPVGWPESSSAASPVASSLPPTGKWVSQKGDKSYTYDVQFLDLAADLVGEYETQDRFRSWDAMLQHLKSHVAVPIGVFYDLGCGAGAISRRVAVSMCVKLISVDLDPGMVAWSHRAVSELPRREGTAKADCRCRDLTDLFSSSAFPVASWKLETPGKANVVWSSFCTAYFHPNIAEVLRSWAEHLLEPREGFMCLVEIQGLFSVHSLDKQELDDLFKQVDDTIVSKLQNDVYAGSKLESIVKDELSDILEIANASEWDDAELAFDGQALPEVARQWTKRLKRPGIQKCVPVDKNFAAQFLSCIQDETHTCRNKVKMLILRRI